MDSFVQGSTKHVRWHSRQEWADALFGTEGLRLEDWLAKGQLEVVKHGPHRSVYRVEMDGREFYVKHFRCHTIWDRVRRWVRPSQANREWRKADRITRRGVPTIRPIAWQEQQGRGAVGESFLVTEAIRNSCTVDEYHRRYLPLLPSKEQRAIHRRLLVEFAQFVAQIHQAGIHHGDFHPSNFVLSLDGQQPAVDRQTGRHGLHLIDVPGVRFSDALAWPAVCAGFVVLNGAWHRQLSQTDRYRFWRAYLAARPEMKVPPLAQVIRQLERQTQAHCRRRLRRRDRRTLRTSQDYAVLRTPQGQAHGVSDLSSDALQRLSTAPETLLWQNMHQPVKLDRGSVIVQADMALEDRAVRVAYKRYRPRTWWKVLLAPFRPARAVQAWLRGHALRLRGIAAARPVVAVDRRRPWYRSESYLAVEWVEGSENLHLYLWRVGAMSEQVRMRQAHRCAESLGRLLGRMHAQRVLHGDLKGSNLLITDRDGQIESCLVDVDGVRLDVDTSLSRRATDLARLAVSLEAHPWVSQSVRMRFLQAYTEEAGRGVVDWKSLWHAVGKRSEPITRRKRRKKQTVL